MKQPALRAEPGAGHPFLAFLNTVTDDGKTRHVNSFADAADMIRHLQQTGIVLHRADIPANQLRAMIDLRETAYAAFSAIAAGRAPGREDALFLTSTLKTVLNDSVMQIGPSGLITTPGPARAPFEQVVLSMEDLLRSDQFIRLRECRRCTHLFLDKGRGIGRRWCSMARCGNRAKSESFRARHRDAA